MAASIVNDTETSVPQKTGDISNNWSIIGFLKEDCVMLLVRFMMKQIFNMTLFSDLYL